MTDMDIEKIADFFTESLRQVLSTMAGFEISHVACDQLNASTDNPIIMGAMVLHGKKDAIISLSMGKRYRSNDYSVYDRNTAPRT